MAEEGHRAIYYKAYWPFLARRCRIDFDRAQVTGRSRLMVDQSEAFARHLVRALDYATDGKPVWWSLPNDLNDAMREAIERAVDRGWILLAGSHSVCLTDAGRDLVKNR